MKMNSNLSERILKYPVCKKDKEVINSLFFSSVKKFPKCFDVIMVLGSRRKNRILTALRLYFLKPMIILLSGGAKLNDQIKECYRDLEYAIAHGVKKNHIICEDQSLNTYQNILYSFHLLRERGYIFSKILIVTSDYHIPRVQAIVEQVIQDYHFHYECSYFPSRSRHQYAGGWFLYPTVRQEFSEEIDKLSHFSN
ncbi:MAG: YdcF family protein [bacterium]|nr:YdcF family protein [bacterium]